MYTNVTVLALASAVKQPCICICMYVHIHMYLCIHVFVYTYEHHVFVYTYEHMYLYKCNIIHIYYICTYKYLHFTQHTQTFALEKSGVCFFMIEFTHIYE